ncbi:conjugative transposon protein TraM [Pedobacter nyackensis]|uniref:Bacteroides conjugative transposon TraM protein n=1 Tax=Pedobacter nyackensis TaxID=475255 RepID=A0A1W2DVK6_9SPHI|nr:conjugative transposon protein TraM [Pedobacter nyackensis]SMD01501.1 Bacteroides conjugative transposon TraM protein [Pedobacter nyackensis]
MSKRMEKRRILLFLPLLALPFMALGFKVLGGGNAETTDTLVSPKGINTALPDAAFKKEVPIDKMGIYNQTKRDSTASADNGFDAIVGKLGFSGAEDIQTGQINEKLAIINREINTPYVTPQGHTEPVKSYGPANESMSKDVAKLEMLMKNMKDSSAEDAEMKQLSTILQSIQEIQNPELARQKYPKAPISEVDSLFKAIPAVIAENQKATQGSVVKLRLLDTIVINGQLIPKDHEVYGLAEFSNQRLNLEIRNIRLSNQIIPVNLTVFDKRDAMRGINAPEALLTDAVNSGGSDAIGGMGIMGFDQSLTTQIAGAGIDAAKSLFTKKLRRIRQKLKAGYPLLLRDNTKKLK